MNHPWRVAQTEGNKKYAEEHYPDVDLIVTDGQNQAQKQVADVESLIARHVKVLMLSPLTEQALTPVAKEAMDAGIAVVTLDRKVNTKVTAHVGPLNLPIAKDAAKFIAEKIGDSGNVLEIQGTAGASATIDRHNGFREELKEHPNIKVVADQYCDFLREPAVKFVEDALQRFPSGQLKAIYAHNDEMALGAIQALEAAGRLKEVTVVGIDGEEIAFKAIKDGKLAATFIYPYVAPEGVEIAYKLAKGETVPAVTILPSQRVDATNVDQFLGKGF
ncbi:MAG: ribose ABC transporter substrate-binding protein [Acidobacteria bacterium]|nr:MAG: ribose ABC transporter substrate-binding protein [Acidobacteriota bacterium]